MHGFEIGGVAILVVGSLAACLHAAWSYRTVGGQRPTSRPVATWAGPSCWAWSS